MLFLFKCKCFYIDNILVIIFNLYLLKYEFKYIFLILIFIKIIVFKIVIYFFRNNYGIFSFNWILSFNSRKIYFGMCFVVCEWNVFFNLDERWKIIW